MNTTIRDIQSLRHAEHCIDRCELSRPARVASGVLQAAVPLLTCTLLAAGLLPANTFGDTRTIALDNAVIQLFIEDDPFALELDELYVWVRRSARIVEQYYGGFPVGEAYVAIRGRPGRGVHHGRALGIAGAVVNVDVGHETTRAHLADDWVLIHELIHLAFPSVPRRHHWIEEGLAVYVESVARANAGVLNAATVWSGFLEGMPNGLPKRGDRGLDHTPTWGRTYWGGALFCLLADIRIREATNGARSLRDALRAIVAAGYDITREAELRPVLELADRAIDTTVLVATTSRSSSSRSKASQS